MFDTPCKCPSFEGLNFEEIIIAAGLRESKENSKNCCELAGYICPNLDSALRKARKERDGKTRLEKKLEVTSENLPIQKAKVYRKRKLVLSNV